MRLEKDGFVLNLEGTWMEISNKYGVQEYGDVAIKVHDIPDGFAEETLDRFIKGHTAYDNLRKDCIKRVAYDESKGGYYQLQAIKRPGENTWIIQKYDRDLIFIEEDITAKMENYEVLEWMRETYDVQRCLTAEVFRSGLGDCTNGGISAERRELYILDSDGPFEPSDIRECVIVERKMILGHEHINAKPVYCQNKWYMMGGNFLYTSDSRFREYTGLSYPIPIHDRYEGR